MKKLTCILKICLFLCALTLSNNAWGFTSTLSGTDLLNSYNNSSKKVSWTHGHVNFSFSGSRLYMTGSKGWLGDTRILYMPNGKDIRYNENTTYTLTWTNTGYDIEVTKVTLNVNRASGESSYIQVGQGTKTGDLFDRLSAADITSGSETYGNGESVPIVFYKAFTWSTCAVNSITIEYNLKPQINASNGSVGVTICDDNKKTIDLKTLAKPVVTNGHVSYSYSIQSVAPAANTSAAKATGHISGSNFYATQAGVYTIKIATTAASCHQANSKTFTVTVTPAALTLTAPTASDIKYHDALSASVLSGGQAKAGDCVVEGSWKWNEPSHKPNIGDDQPFAVTFVPAADAGNYTNFSTNALVDVKRAHFIFDGSGDGAGDTDHVKWCKNDNWDENLVPVLDDEVVIEHNVVIVQQVAAYSVEIKEGVSLTIAPTGGLTVGAGGITGATKDNLILKAGISGETKGQTGYLRISPEYTGAMPEATVELFSIGYCDYELGLKNPAAWQYIGYPMADAGIKAKSIFYGWIYDWNEATGEWKNNRKNLLLNPFTGYAVTQDYTPEGDMYVFGGQFVPNENKVLNLQYTPESAEPGCNVFANSYSAPIDITLIEETDFSEGVEASIHLFNTGSRSDAEARAGQAVDLKAAGQYISIPVKKVKALAQDFDYPTIIPAMQGFYVNTNKAGTLTLDYEKLVWNANYTTHSNTPLRAPKYDGDADEEETSGALCVTVATEKWSDNLYILESAENIKAFENGHDAHKMMNGELNVFAVEGADNLSVDATDNMSGTYIGVRTGDTTAYTLRFSHLRSERNLALRDHVADLTIDIDKDTEYMFFAEPNSMITDRFEIVSRDEDEQSGVATALDNAENSTKVQKFVKNNQLFVLKNGVLYNAQGIVVEK